MAKKEEIKDVTVAIQNEVIPDYIKKDSNRGSEDVQMDDLTIPRIDIVQALSPCRKKSDPAYIEGAEEGMLFNNVTRDLFGTETLVVPVLFKKEYIIWKDRDAGGGFRGAFDNVEEAHRTIENLNAEGDVGPFDVVDTAQHLCLQVIMDDKGNIIKVNEVVISMSRSKMKVSRQWNSIIRLMGGDRFSGMYKLSTVEDSSEKGDYHNFKVERVGFSPKTVYLKAEEIYLEISEGARTLEINREVDENASDNVDTKNSEF